MEVEREQLAQPANGKMARMIGRALPGESQQKLDLVASDDRYLAQQGYVLLRQGEKVWHKHIDELTPQDSQARLEYEKTLVRWLKVAYRTGRRSPRSSSQAQFPRRSEPVEKLLRALF